MGARQANMGQLRLGHVSRRSATALRGPFAILGAPPIERGVPPRASHRIAADLYQQHGNVTTSIVDQLRSRQNKPLDAEISYESRPNAARSISTAEDAALRVVRLAHVWPHDLVEASGFICDTSKGPILISCAHPLRQAEAVRKDVSRPLITLAFHRSGEAVRLNTISSLMEQDDILIYDLANTKSLETLSCPINPYPPAEGERVSFAQLRHLDGTSRSAWVEGTVAGYRDPIGREATAGTYDELAELLVTSFPEPGASGGPLVDSNGTVCGIMRGTRSAYTEQRRHGFATPAEKLWEIANLPGMPGRS